MESLLIIEGQGAGVAMKDAAALIVVFPAGTASGEVAERLKLYEHIRYERANAIQEFSRKAGLDWINGEPQSIYRCTPFTISVMTSGIIPKKHSETGRRQRNRAFTGGCL